MSKMLYAMWRLYVLRHPEQRNLRIVGVYKICIHVRSGDGYTYSIYKPEIENNRSCWLW